MDATDSVRREFLLFLAEQPDEMAAVAELPAHLLDADVLTVLDADGMIEFGTRSHCYVGPVANSELRVERGWGFGSVTGPGRGPMSRTIARALSYSGDERLRLHVRLTHRGRVECARHRCDAVSAAAIAAAMERCPTVLETLVYLYHRQGETRQTTTLERETRPRITHVVGESCAAALEWVYKRCTWPENSNGAELFAFIPQVARGGVGDPLVREVVVPRLAELDRPGNLRSLWRVLLGRFPHLGSELMANAAVAASGPEAGLLRLSADAGTGEDGAQSRGADKPLPDRKATRRPKRTDADIARDEGVIAGHLLEQPHATRDDVAKATGIARGHVSASLVWKRHKDRKEQARKANRARGAGGVGDPSVDRVGGDDDD